MEEEVEGEEKERRRKVQSKNVEDQEGMLVRALMSIHLRRCEGNLVSRGKLQRG